MHIPNKLSFNSLVQYLKLYTSGFLEENKIVYKHWVHFLSFYPYIMSDF